jgi:rare lipoprotein A
MTANGETFDQFHLSGAHTTLPLPSYVRVQNLANGHSVVVRINDRGPFAHNRLIDVSKRTAEVLGFIDSGTAQVRVTYIGRAPVEGDDTQYLVASIDAPGGGVPNNVFLPSPTTRTVTRPPSIIGRQSGGLLGSFISLFSYADTGLSLGQGAEIVSGAHAAVNQVAGNVSELDAWKSNVEAAQLDTAQINAVQIIAEPEFNGDRELGVFSNVEIAREISRQFALLGAVEQLHVLLESGPATRVILRELKSGVSMQDIEELAEKLNP